MSTLSPAFGPQPRDELAAWSDAPLADLVTTPIPGYAEPSPPGEVHLVSGTGIFVRRTVGPDGAPSVWYIHGLEGASGNWDRLAAALAGVSDGYAPDLPGSGLSDPPPRGRFSVVGEADLIARLIETTTGGPVHLVGNSRGAVVATYLAARHPHLVRSLTVISPAVPDLRLVGERGADPRLGLVLLPGIGGVAERRLAAAGPDARARGMAAACFGEPELLTADDLAAAAREFARRSTLPWTHRATVGSLRSLIRAQLRPGRWSFAAAAGSVRVPVLVVWGTRDRLVDVRLARRTARAYPEATMLILPRTGHVAQMERPEQTARAMVALWDRAAHAAGRGSGAPRPTAGSPVAT